jgi:DtxR family Mn-dependent transcriptional regulator
MLLKNLAMPKTAPASSAKEDYLKAVFHLTQPGERVTTSAIAERLGVRDPSVTAMLKRLAADGLVDYEPRQGALLTDEGRRACMRVVRRHRLLETFLVEILDLDWSEVHEEAEVLEHHLSERIVDAMDHVLGHPFEDPHGHPIPDSEGKIRKRDLEELAALPVGAVATVRELRTDEPERLVRWKQLGLVPGARCKMLDRRALEDVMRLRVSGEELLSGSEGVEGVFVEVDS